MAKNKAILDQQKARLIQSQQARGQQTNQQQQTALSDLGSPTSADDAAQRLASVADPILAQKQKDISNAFESVDPFDEVKALRIPMAKIEGILQNNYGGYRDWETDRKSTRLNSSHSAKSRMPSSA